MRDRGGKAAFGGTIIHWDVDCAHGTHTCAYTRADLTIDTVTVADRSNFGSYFSSRGTMDPDVEVARGNFTHRPR